MQFFMVTGYSTIDSGEAMANALGRSMALGEGAESVHVLVLELVKVGDGWQVSVKVVVEPHIEMPAPANASMEEGRQAKLKEEQKPKEGPEQTHIHIYALTEISDLVQEYLAKQDLHPYPYFHVMTEGPLWEEALHFFPDVEFYEAAHQGGEEVTYKTKNTPDAQLELGSFVTKLKEHRAKHSLDLDD